MQIRELEMSGLFLIEPKVHGDERGYFFESFREDLFQTQVGKIHFVQENESRSAKGVLRGLHFQTGVKAQSKLIRVIQGKIFDVVVDLRKNSKTFGKIFSLELSAENKRQFFIPKGFAHGYLSLSDDTIIQYKVDEYYSKGDEHGIRFDDPDLKVNWPKTTNEFLVSDKDKALGFFRDLAPQLSN